MPLTVEEREQVASELKRFANDLNLNDQQKEKLHHALGEARERVAEYLKAHPNTSRADIIAKVNADMAATLNDVAIKEKFKLLGVLPRASTTQELTAMNVADAKLWAPIIKEANIKVE